MAGYLLAAAILFCIQGLSSGKEQETPYMQLYKRSSCQPREVLVNIVKQHPQETAHFFKPSCVVLQRCAGCCNDDSLKCFPVMKQSISLQIMRVIPNTRTTQMEWMNFTEHLTCECR
ncbi:snake venom vascular endothelial growth factor toxin apiscin-like [Ahaetulla prasina]|uniref:snake venom vascular endothelial growth factor toxin apiscin-like n=1 Tax=Ahaetulla prasina TaxID=499056 RepID=UPI002649C9C7|nr:snake venom vascular endothelial growth factor toxin apiscin-like [Ahaetulla prasina]